MKKIAVKPLEQAQAPKKPSATPSASLFTQAAHLDVPRIPGRLPAKRPTRRELAALTPSFVEELMAAYLIPIPRNTGASFSEERRERLASWRNQQATVAS